jgi:hypothetical protein
MSHRALLCSMVLVSLALGMAAAPATAKVRHKHVGSGQQWSYTPQTQNVYVSGTLAGADPDPNIRAALIREFGRRR